jgi:hypothetical protein
MRIAEDLLLLLTDDESGRLAAPADHVDLALAGANLVELTLAGRVDLTAEGDVDKPGRIVVRDPSLTGDEVLDAALEILVDHQGEKPGRALKPLSKNLRRTLYERMTRAGVVRAEEGKILGIFPTHRWPAQDSGHEAEVRQGITQALVQQTTPEARTAALISLLHALRCEGKVADAGDHGLSKRELRKRAGEIAKGSWASEAVRKAIDDTTAALAAIVVASSSGSAT